MTPRQIELSRHALGLDGRRRVSYRNRFWAGPGHADYDDWQDLVAQGDAFVSQPREGVRQNHAFWLTREGAEKALRDGEHLDPEDFPASGKKGLRPKSF